MNRKLLLLNLALAASVIYAGVRIREAYLAAKTREAATMARKPAPAPAPPFHALPASQSVQPSGYLDIAQKMLFDKSRDSTVVVETPKPPAPPPVPPMPRYYGQMRFPGEPLTVILSEKENEPQKGYQVGAQVGPFKLVDANAREIGLEWNGQVIRKSVDELLDRKVSPDQVASAAPQGGAAGATSLMPQAPLIKQETGPGPETGTGERYCDPNDSTAAGTVVNGMRKMTRKLPFGTSCWWEPVNR